MNNSKSHAPELGIYLSKSGKPHYQCPASWINPRLPSTNPKTLAKVEIPPTPASRPRWAFDYSSSASSFHSPLLSSKKLIPLFQTEISLSVLLLLNYFELETLASLCLHRNSPFLIYLLLNLLFSWYDLKEQLHELQTCLFLVAYAF